MQYTRFICCVFMLLACAGAATAQKGEWFTFSTGRAPLTRIQISDDELVLDRTDAAFREVKLNARAAAGTTQEHVRILKKVHANDRIYVIHESFDSLFFCTTFRYFKKQDSLVMYCADGVDNGYRSAKDALAAIKADNGKQFSIVLYRRERLQELQRRHVPISKATQEEFRNGLQQFTRNMDEFWQYRGYGKYEPYHAWMALIYGNAFANAFDPKFNKLSLDPKNLRLLTERYGKDPETAKLLQDAGLQDGE